MNVLEAILAAQNGGAVPQVGHQFGRGDANRDGSMKDDVAGMPGRVLSGR